VKAKRILVVEDNRVTQKIIADVLKSAGYEVFTAASAGAAVKAAREHQPDLITLDIELTLDSPDDSWDGFNVASWLRRVNEGKGKLVILVISGQRDWEKLLEKAASVGAYTCLAKPIEKQKLLEVVAAALQ
jgi:two-component system, OmpR family, response regulator